MLNVTLNKTGGKDVGITVASQDGVEGVVVLNASADGIAAQAGLLAGDVILAIDGEENLDHIKAINLVNQASGTLTLRIFRDIDSRPRCLIVCLLVVVALFCAGVALIGSGVLTPPATNTHLSFKRLPAKSEFVTADILPRFSHDRCTCRRAVCTRLATAAELNSPKAHDIMRDLQDGPIRMHRKQWEFVFIIRALNESGMLRPGKRAMVFAAGHEPLISYFASLGIHVLATDMDVQGAYQQGWATTNQHASKREDLFRKGMLPKRKFDELVEYRTADMNHVDPALHGKFDFVWTTCSLEHVGSIALGKQFVLNSMNLLRPGGVSVHTTEFTLSSMGQTVDSVSGEYVPTVLWREQDIKALLKSLQAYGHKTGQTCLAAGEQELDKYVDLPPYRSHSHMRLAVGGHAVTSVGWVAQSPPHPLHHQQLHTPKPRPRRRQHHLKH